MKLQTVHGHYFKDWTKDRRVPVYALRVFKTNAIYMFILCLICLLTARFYDLRWWLFGHSVLDELPINLFIYSRCQEDWMTSMISRLFLQHHGTVVILRLFFMTTSEWIAMKFCTISRPLGKTLTNSKSTCCCSKNGKNGERCTG